MATLLRYLPPLCPVSLHGAVRAWARVGLTFVVGMAFTGSSLYLGAYARKYVLLWLLKSRVAARVEPQITPSTSHVHRCSETRGEIDLLRERFLRVHGGAADY